MLSLLTSVLLLLPATPQEPAPTCPSQQATQVVKAECDSKSECSSKVATQVVKAECESKAAACDAKSECDSATIVKASKIHDMDYALASITKKLDAQEPECSSKTACETQVACDSKAACPSTEASYSVVMMKIDERLGQSGCETKSDCSTKTDCETQQACPSQEIAQTVRLVSDQQSVCSEVKAQECKPTACDSKAAATCDSKAAASCDSQLTIVGDFRTTSACDSEAAATCDSKAAATCDSKATIVSNSKAAATCDSKAAATCDSEVTIVSNIKAEACATSECQPAAECSEAKTQTNTIVHLVEEVVEEECGECAVTCEEEIACSEEIVVACEEGAECTEAATLVEFVQEEEGCCCSESSAAAKSECHEVVVASNVAKAECSELNVECNEFITDGGEKQIAVVVRVEGEMDNLDAQIHELLRQVELGDKGNGKAMIRVRGAEDGVHWNVRGADQKKVIKLQSADGIAFAFDTAGDCEVACDDAKAESCCDSAKAECNEATTAKDLIRKRVEMRQPMVLKKRMELHEDHGDHGHPGHQAKNTYNSAHGQQNVAQRLSELEARLVRIERMLARLEQRL